MRLLITDSRNRQVARCWSKPTSDQRFKSCLGRHFLSSEIALCKRDTNRGLHLPNNLTKELAEDIGIHIGDGCLTISGKDHAIVCTGHTIDDNIYLKHFVAPLKYYLYGIEPSRKIYGNEYNLVVRSKTLARYYSEVLKMPIGSKENIEIPNYIVNSQFLTDCLRGIIDTDFSLSFKNKGKVHNYPVLSAFFKSKKLVMQLEKIFINLEFSVHAEYDVKRFDKRTSKFYIASSIYLNGKNNLSLWLSKIGTNNIKHLSKYLVWKKLGFCPPRTSTVYRIEMLRSA